MHFFHLFKYCYLLLISVYRQRKFTREYLYPLVESITAKTQYSLNVSEKKKVFYYYPVFTILACAEMYLAIRNRNINTDERKRLTLICVMATLYDDLIDEEHWQQKELLDLLHERTAFEKLSGKAQLIFLLNEELKKHWVRTTSFNHFLETAIDWQIKSSEQLNPTITKEEIEFISRNKNGNTSLMFASILDETWDENETKFIFQSAMVGQLLNDAFDVYKDLQDGVNTTFLKSNSVKEATDFFVKECSALHQSVLNCNTSKSIKEHCIRRMSCVHAYALLAFDYLQKVETRFGTINTWKNLPRKILITDTAKWKVYKKFPFKILWLSKQR